MTAVAYAHPTISRFAIADGMLHIGGPRAEIGDLVAVFSGRRLRDYGQSHSVPRPSDTDAAVGVDRRPPGLHDR
jgi:hypothetical protein